MSESIDKYKHMYDDLKDVYDAMGNKRIEELGREAFAANDKNTASKCAFRLLKLRFNDAVGPYENVEGMYHIEDMPYELLNWIYQFKAESGKLWVPFYKGHDTNPDNNPEVEAVEIPDGLTLIMGPSNTGKSYICEYIAKIAKTKPIIFYEPDVPSIISPTEMIGILQDFLISDQNLLCIDSLRYFAYSSNARSAAIQGGISAGLINEMTKLSNLFSFRGKKLVAIMNFLTQDDRNREMIANLVIGAVNGIIDMAPEQVLRFRVSTRTESNKREFHEYALERGVDLVADLKDHEVASVVPFKELDNKDDFRWRDIGV